MKIVVIGGTGLIGSKPGLLDEEPLGQTDSSIPESDQGRLRLG